MMLAGSCGLLLPRDPRSSVRDRVLLHVEPTRLASNHQLARLVHDLRLQIVCSAIDLFQLKRRAADHLRVAVEVHPNPVAALQPRLQAQTDIQYAFDIP